MNEQIKDGDIVRRRWGKLTEQVGRVTQSRPRLDHCYVLWEGRRAELRIEKRYIKKVEVSK